MSTPIMYVLLSFVPVGIFSLALEIWHRLQANHRQLPTQAKLLRPPGESCRRKIEELDEKMNDIICWILGVPATLLICYLSQNGTNIPARRELGLWIFALAIPALVLAVLIGKYIGLREKRGSYRLGLYGEQIVGEELNQLMCDGCRVFHDFPLADNWNIDHIVVAPSGVFAIETKARRKGGASSSQPAHEIVYDGNTLEFPFCTNTDDLAEARDQAQGLAKFLAEKIKEPPAVKPILTFPGWYIINRSQGDVLVLNPKMIAAAILTPFAPMLSAGRISEIARLLDQKCRDVEF